MKSGFTLVEIVIVISILIMIMGGSMSALSAFKERRTAQADAQLVAEKLRSVQVRASAVEVPSGCTTVQNYTVTMNGSGLSVVVNCAVGGPFTVSEMATTLQGSRFNSPVSIVFSSPLGTTSVQNVDVCSSPTLYRVSVSGSGNVSVPTLVPAGC